MMNTSRQLTAEEKAELGIEIVAALHAFGANATLEDGRIMALQETEVDRHETPEYWAAMGEDDRAQALAYIERTKKRLYGQANFLADATLNKLVLFHESDNHRKTSALVEALEMFVEETKMHLGYSLHNENWLGMRKAFELSEKALKEYREANSRSAHLIQK